MKYGSLGGLIYTEFLKSKTRLIGYSIPNIIILILGVLCSISIKHGNLALIADSPHIEALFIGSLDSIIKFVPSVSLTFATLTYSDTVIYDVKANRSHFRRSTPVSHLKYSIAKYILITATYIISIVIGIAYQMIIGKIGGNPVTVKNISILILGGTVFLMVTMLMLNCVLRANSIDRGMLLAMGLMIVIMIIPSVIINIKGINITPKKLMTFAQGHIAALIIADILIITASCLVTAMLYKRREK